MARGFSAGTLFFPSLDSRKNEKPKNCVRMIDRTIYTCKYVLHLSENIYVLTQKQSYRAVASKFFFGRSIQFVPLGI
jgi:hypothetical protein